MNNFEWDIKTYVGKAICNVGNFKMTITDITTHGIKRYLLEVYYKDRYLFIEGSVKDFENAQRMCEKVVVDIIDESVAIANKAEKELLKEEFQKLNTEIT